MKKVGNFLGMDLYVHSGIPEDSICIMTDTQIAAIENLFSDKLIVRTDKLPLEFIKRIYPSSKRAG